MHQSRLTPNQLVAHNLRAAREARGLTQEQAATLLEPFLGEHWSVAVFSAAERSVAGKRVREFDADTIQALARAFELPIGYFFLPPDAKTVVGLNDADSPAADTQEQVALASVVSKPLRDRIDELTRQLPAAERGTILRYLAAHPGGMSENEVIAGAVERMRAELETLTALVANENGAG